MSNDGSNYKPWKVRKGIFKSTGTSDYVLPQRNSTSPIIEMPLSPPVKAPSSPLTPLSPRVTIVESPLSPQPSVANNSPSSPINIIQPQIIHRTVREIPIERVDEVRFSYLKRNTINFFLKINKDTYIRAKNSRKVNVCFLLFALMPQAVLRNFC